MSGTQGPADAVTAGAVGRDWGLNVDLYVVELAWAAAAVVADEGCCAVSVAGAVVGAVAAVVCETGAVVWAAVAVVAGTENEDGNEKVGVLCLAGWIELADAVDGANVADTTTRAAAAPAHAASEAIGASRRRLRARWLGRRAGRMRRDTGRDSGSDGE